MPIRPGQRRGLEPDLGNKPYKHGSPYPTASAMLPSYRLDRLFIGCCGDDRIDLVPADIDDTAHAIIELAGDRSRRRLGLNDAVRALRGCRTRKTDGGSEPHADDQDHLDKKVLTYPRCSLAYCSAPEGALLGLD